MTPKAAIFDAGDKAWYLLDNEHTNVPKPIPVYEYTVIKRSLLCDCQLQEENGMNFYMNL